MKTRSKVLITFIFSTGFYALLQFIASIILKDENIISSIVYNSLTMGIFYLLYFFVYSRRRRLFTGIMVLFALILLTIILSNFNIACDVNSWNFHFIFRILYYTIIGVIAYYQAIEIHFMKIIEYNIRKFFEEMIESILVENISQEDNYENK